MRQPQENLYEGMYVIAANLSEDIKKHVIERIKASIEDNGGEIVKEHEIGRKRLAYEIEKHKEGYYLLLYFKALPGVITSLWKDYHLMGELLRFMTVRVDEVKEKLEYKPLPQS